MMLKIVEKVESAVFITQSTQSFNL